MSLQRKAAYSALGALLCLGTSSQANSRGGSRQAAVTSVQAPSPKNIRERHLSNKVHARPPLRSLQRASNAMQRLGESDVSLGKGPTRDTIAKQPLLARLELFQSRATSKALSVPSFSRRLRGIVTKGKSKRSRSSMKTFFNVLPETAEIFREAMGGNTVWFTSQQSPEHLHTLIADQNGGSNLTHNTYGVIRENAKITNRPQYSVPVQLSTAQMDRFARYVNTASKSAGYNKKNTRVYGFKARGGKYVETACTNWATSAPVGDLLRWASTLDRRVKTASQKGTLSPEFSKGLHHAFANAKDGPTRDALAKKALAAGLGKVSNAQIKKLRAEFSVSAAKYPNRPLDLVARKSLAEVVGVSRSQDPAKWLYDLMLSPKVPAVAVFSESKIKRFSQMRFDLQVMGEFKKTGRVGPSDFRPEGSPKSRVPKAGTPGALGMKPKTKRPF